MVLEYRYRSKNFESQLLSSVRGFGVDNDAFVTAVLPVIRKYMGDSVGKGYTRRNLYNLTNLIIEFVKFLPVSTKYKIYKLVDLYIRSNSSLDNFNRMLKVDFLS